MLAHLRRAPLVVGDLVGGRSEEGAVEGKTNNGVPRAEVVQASRIDATEDSCWPDDSPAMAGEASRCAELADETGRLNEVDLALVLAERDLAGGEQEEGSCRLSLGEEDFAIVRAHRLEKLCQALDLFVTKTTEEGDATQLGWANANLLDHREGAYHGAVAVADIAAKIPMSPTPALAAPATPACTIVHAGDTMPVGGPPQAAIRRNPMPIKKSELYSRLWQSCDELRGGMDASEYKNYILVLLFIKYVSDKFAGQPYAEIIQDIEGHLQGGIPAAEVDAESAMAPYWMVCPRLKKALFEGQRKGYFDLKVAKADIKTTIYEHPEFADFIAQMNAHFAVWKKKSTGMLKALKPGFHPKELIAKLSEGLLDHYADRPLVDPYDIYQHLMGYWAQTMQDDAYLVADEGSDGGWHAETRSTRPTWPSA